jgi:hypothetical protein
MSSCITRLLRFPGPCSAVARTRTGALRIKSPLLYQLSYDGRFCDDGREMGGVVAG